MSINIKSEERGNKRAAIVVSTDFIDGPVTCQWEQDHGMVEIFKGHELVAESVEIHEKGIAYQPRVAHCNI